MSRPPIVGCAALPPRLAAAVERTYRQQPLPGTHVEPAQRPMCPELREQIARTWDAWAGNDPVRRAHAAELRAESDARARLAAQRRGVR